MDLFFELKKNQKPIFLGAKVVLGFERTCNRYILYIYIYIGKLSGKTQTLLLLGKVFDHQP